MTVHIYIPVLEMWRQDAALGSLVRQPSLAGQSQVPLRELFSQNQGGWCWRSDKHPRVTSWLLIQVYVHAHRHTQARMWYDSRSYDSGEKYTEF